MAENIVSLDESTLDSASEAELEGYLEKAISAEQSETVPEQPQAEEAETKLEDKLKAMESEIEKYKKQLKDKEDFIQRRNAEVGLLRKQLRERQQALAEEELSEDEILADPKEAIKKALRREKEKEALEAEDKRLAFEEAKIHNRSVIDKLIPDFDSITPNIAEVIASDGAPESMVEQFMADPVATLPPPVLFQLAKRAEMQKRIAELEAQLAELKQQPKKLIENLKFSQSKSPVSSAPTTPKKSSRLANLTEADIDRMSADELAELEKELL